MKFKIKTLIILLLTSLINLTSCSKATENTSVEIPLTQRLRSLETRKISKLSPKVFVKDLKEKGYNVLTTGAMYGTGIALMGNDVYPLHPKVDSQWLQTVIKECHKQDIKVNCWVVFNIQDVQHKNQYIIDDLYPESEIKFLNKESLDSNSFNQTGMCMVSSPYKKEHTKFIKQVAALGSDGIWFDGFYHMGMPGRGKPGCICMFCKKKFKKDTGLKLPDKIDWNDLTFKKWVRWRNEQLFATAKQLSDDIHKINPTCKVTFNTNTWPFFYKDWISAVPLWKTDDFGVSQHAFFPVPEKRWLMMGYKSRLAHDMNPNHSDIWQHSVNRFKSGNEEKDVEMNRIYTAMHNYAGITFGTTPWKAGEDSSQAKINNQRLAEMEKWFQTNQIKDIAILISQNTHDFWGHQVGTNNLNKYRNSVLGTWQLLTENHMQFEFVFDNQVNFEELKNFKTIILPNTACLSHNQIAQLTLYAKSGGQLIITENAGKLDEWADKPNNIDEIKSLASYFEIDPGRMYLQDKENQQSLELLNLLKNRGESDVKVIAPNFIASNTFRGKDGKLYVHLLNGRSLYLDEENSGFSGLSDSLSKISDCDYNPQEFIDTDIYITFSDELSEKIIAYPNNSGLERISNNRFKISKMGLHQMILVKPIKNNKLN